jgi:hypothetical protein
MVDAGIENLQALFYCEGKFSDELNDKVCNSFYSLSKKSSEFLRNRDFIKNFAIKEKLSIIYKFDDINRISLDGYLLVFLTCCKRSQKFNNLISSVLNIISKNTIVHVFYIDVENDKNISKPFSNEVVISTSNIDNIVFYVNDLCTNLMFGRMVSFDWRDIIDFLCKNKFKLIVYEFDNYFYPDHFIEFLFKSNIPIKFQSIFLNIVYYDSKYLVNKNIDAILDTIDGMIEKGGKSFFIETFVKDSNCNRISLLCSFS